MLRDSKNCKLLHKKKHLKRERKEIPFKELKHLVGERDGFKCRLCGSSDNLTVHHIKEGDDLESIVTICEGCHKLLHSNRGLVS